MSRNLVRAARHNLLKHLTLSWRQVGQEYESLLRNGRPVAIRRTNLQCHIDARKERIVGKGLLDKIDCTRFHGSNRKRYVSMSRDEYYGQRNGAPHDFSL